MFGCTFIQHRRVLHEALCRSAKFSSDRPHVAFFSVGAVLQTVAMTGEEMSITYIVVLGFEAITALCLSIFFLKESSSFTKLAGVALVLAGIVVLRTGKP
jgi:multidrug transporter EmrE-like cation transporter